MYSRAAALAHGHCYIFLASSEDSTPVTAPNKILVSALEITQTPEPCCRREGKADTGFLVSKHWQEHSGSHDSHVSHDGHVSHGGHTNHAGHT